MQGLKKINGKEVYIDSKRVKHGDEMLNEVLEDTGWINLPLINGWVRHNTTFEQLQYRKIGNVLYLRGMIRNPNESGRTSFSQLPPHFRKSTDYYLCNMEQQPVIIRIDSDGKMWSNHDYLKNSWLTLEGTFFIID